MASCPLPPSVQMSVGRGWAFHMIAGHNFWKSGATGTSGCTLCIAQMRRLPAWQSGAHCTANATDLRWLHSTLWSTYPTYYQYSYYCMAVYSYFIFLQLITPDSEVLCLKTSCITKRGMESTDQKTNWNQVFHTIAFAAAAVLSMLSSWKCAWAKSTPCSWSRSWSWVMKSCDQVISSLSCSILHPSPRPSHRSIHL